MYTGKILGHHSYQDNNKKSCVFVGPSLWYRHQGKQYSFKKTIQNIDFFAPAAMGHIHQSVLQGYQQIVLIDGRFGDCPAPWHKEILFALDQGCNVYGASSMGALRAAELNIFGMQGHGEVFAMYEKGEIENDDAVCVAHTDVHHLFRPVSIALVDVILTLKRMHNKNLINDRQQTAIVHELNKVHYPKRTMALIHELVRNQNIGIDAFEDNYVNAKFQDFEQLLTSLSNAKTSNSTTEISLKWALPITDHWRHQFVLHRDDLPALEPFNLM